MSVLEKESSSSSSHDLIDSKAGTMIMPSSSASKSISVAVIFLEAVFTAGSVSSESARGRFCCADARFTQMSSRNEGAQITETTTSKKKKKKRSLLKQREKSAGVDAVTPLPIRGSPSAGHWKSSRSKGGRVTLETSEAGGPRGEAGKSGLGGCKLRCKLR